MTLSALPRAEMRRLRQEPAPADREERRRPVAERIWALAAFSRARDLLSCAASGGGEETLASLRRWIEEGRTRGRGRVIPWETIDVVVVSGSVFDLTGNRSGLGRGDDDRAVVRLGPQGYTIGLAFDFQAIKDLPVEANDVPLDLLVTVTQTIAARPAKRNSTVGALRR